jgi:hypothetical protein
MAMMLMALLLAADPSVVAAPDCKSCDCAHWLWADRCKPCCEPVGIVTVATAEQFVDVLRLDPALAARVVEARKGKRIEKLTDLTLSRSDLNALEKKVSELSPGQMNAILPSIELSGEVTDENDHPIAHNAAPFVVKVKGNAHILAGLYAYLVVKDAAAEWIEPSGALARVASRSEPGSQAFTEYGYLGEKEVLPPSTGTEYTCFAVVVDTPHAAYTHLKPATVRARSQEIKLRRTH